MILMIWICNIGYLNNVIEALVLILSFDCDF